MPVTAEVLIFPLLANATALFLLWLVSLKLRDASIIDIYWGIGFALMACVAGAAGEAPLPRKALVIGLTVVWGLRLGAYLAWRNLGHGEDPRYQAMRKKHGERFGSVSLYSVYGLQCVLGWLVALPVLLASASSASPAPVTRIDGIGIVLFIIGITFETIGDLQLARFRADPANKGKVLDRGLWKFTRHPNYFGDAVVWWGLFLIACSSPFAIWSFLSPVLMTFLLMRVSGVPMLEYKLKRTRPGYEDYIRRTSSFLPMRPRD